MACKLLPLDAVRNKVEVSKHHSVHLAEKGALKKKTLTLTPQALKPKP